MACRDRIKTTQDDRVEGGKVLDGGLRSDPEWGRVWAAGGGGWGVEVPKRGRGGTACAA